MRKPARSSFTTQYFILFGVVFLVVNIILGYSLHEQSAGIVRALIRKSMLNVSNTAADLIDGDVIGKLTEADIGSEQYKVIYDDLAAFQNNTDVEYIYAVRQTGPDKYIFTVDPDPKEPATFGDEVLVTEALVSAAKGTAAIDNAPAEDQWGNFYSAYSPIFDSSGKVAGIVGVDFSSSWYDGQIWKNTIFIIVISVLFTLVGFMALLVLGIRMRRRFDALNRELSMLSDDVEELTRQIQNSSGPQDHPGQAADSGSEKDRGSEDNGVDSGSEDNGKEDEILTLGNKIHSMHQELDQYIEYMHIRVNTDALTGVGNTTAYTERMERLDALIRDGSAAFSLVMFDINDLKLINDNYGHVGGDKAIRTAGAIISRVYGDKNTFRIGGDEFIVITEQLSEEQAHKLSADLDYMLAEYNRNRAAKDAELSLSRGQTSFIPGQDHTFRDVFKRADEQMYKEKDAYHNR